VRGVVRVAMTIVAAMLVRAGVCLHRVGHA
jgi:hypothetical protein